MDRFRFDLRTLFALTIYMGILVTASWDAVLLGFVGMVGAAVFLILYGMQALKCPLWIILTALVIFAVWFFAAAATPVSLDHCQSGRRSDDGSEGRDAAFTGSDPEFGAVNLTTYAIGTYVNISREPAVTLRMSQRLLNRF